MQQLVKRSQEIQDTRHNPEAEPLRRELAGAKNPPFGVSPGWAKIVGVGGAGITIADHLYRLDADFTEILAFDTDKQNLAAIKADRKILIDNSQNKGPGTDGYLEIDRQAAEQARGTLQEVLESSDLVFITAGMDCGTGTGAAPAIAGIAKAKGSCVISIVTMPTKRGRTHGMNPDEEVEKLMAASNLLILIDREKLQTYLPGQTCIDLDLVTDQLICEAMKAIVDLVEQPQLRMIRQSDLKHILTSRRCLGALLFAEYEGSIENRALNIARKAVNCKLWDLDYRRASGGLVIITCGKDMRLRECEEIVYYIGAMIGLYTSLMWATNLRPDYEGKVKVIVFLTGLGKGVKTSIDDR